MIILDTHIWVWWVQRDPRLSTSHQAFIRKYQPAGIGISVISCLEVARLAAKGRLDLPQSVEDWIDQALAYPSVELLPLVPEIAVHSTQLPGDFHRDPADRIIVATARLYDCPLLTEDALILKYPHVKLANVTHPE